jgi:hypothetical protein
MNEELFFSKLIQYESIIVYGAGMVGELVYKRLLRHNMDNKVIGFAVSRKTSETFFCKKQVFEIGEFEGCRESSVVIVAVMPNTHSQMQQKLSEYGFENVVYIEQKLYDDISRNYIDDFRKANPVLQNKVDVLFMASDNNRTSGAFLSMVDLNKELTKKGVSTLIVLPEYGNGESILIDSNLDYTYIPSRPWAVCTDGKNAEDTELCLEQNTRAVKELEEIIKNCQISIVHNNTTYTYVGAVAGHNAGAHVVWHLRENIKEQGFEFMDAARAIDFINKSDRICLVSNYMQSVYGGLDNGKVDIVYNGVDIEKYYSAGRVLFENKKIKIVSVGVLTPLKGQMDLVEAAWILCRDGIDFEIDFIGNGDADYIQKLKELITEYQLGDKIFFLGRQDNMKEFYSQADIAVVSSRAESFGRVTIEAQLAGCLVIGANAGATPELISNGQTGYIYQHRNGEELAQKIIYAVNHPSVSRAIALSGQEYATVTYSKENNADRIFKIYQQIMK